MEVNNTEIVERIVKVIVSPETVVGLLDGAMSVPVDFGYLALGIFDTSNRRKMEDERIRMMRAIKSGLLNYHQVIRTTKIIIDAFTAHIPKATQDKIFRGAGSASAGRMLTTSLISSRIVNSIISAGGAAMITRGAGVATSFTLMAGGMIERSIYKSIGLERMHSAVYYKLRSAGNLDFIYFLVQPYVDPFIEALAIRKNQGDAEFNRLLQNIEEKMK
ncbi:hypothetical protein [Serratia marcescens]|uniref:hypothetical protein n=1 Tax=Serratia marcescens TaxID=615 RepID=UPI000B5F69EF|nr:hypothetical protein [Serratia marcescens]ASM11633.1 hypothetical protein BVG93_06670 [Serratia marcescens]